MKKIIPLAIIVLVIIGSGVTWKLTKKEAPATVVTNFEECVKTGNAVMESYPRQCRYGDKTFVEDIGNTIEKTDLIHLESPRPNQIVKSPLTIRGEARGNWFFEASFPVALTNWDGLIIAQGIATAKSEWMTNDFVPFEAVLTFKSDKNVYSNRGTLILRKDNPSGLPKHDDALEIPVLISL
ncbi:MAG: Gmad2 immunoglobulin-like domain-containing protein [bacterium]|nr:Gmad2 immunoglobulin-like domain-containing protein [bacterium]